MTFEVLLCILLYLSVIFSPGTYTEQEIMDFESANQSQIDPVHADPNLENTIVQTYTPQLEFLDIWHHDAEE